MKKYLLFPLVCLISLSQSAFAVIDHNPIDQRISEGNTLVVTLGLAVLAVCALILSIKLIKRIL